MVKSKLMMLSLEWEDSPPCSMTVLPWTPSAESLSEDILSLNSAKKHKKPQMAFNHCPSQCSSCCSQEDIPPNNNLMHFLMNGKQEVTWISLKSILSPHCQENSTQWPCYQWLFYIYKRTVNSSKLITRESTKPNIGNLITKILWTCWPNFPKFVLLSTDTNITTLG